MTRPNELQKYTQRNFNPTRDRIVDGNKFFNVPRTPDDDRPPHGMGEGSPTQGEYRDMAAGETLLARLAKLLGW